MGRLLAWLRRLLAPPAPEPPAPTPPPTPPQSHLDAIALQAVAAINAARQGQGLGLFASEDRLGRAAQAHALDMAAHHLLSHTGADGGSVVTRVAAEGYRYLDVGETIERDSPTAAAAVADWMNSPTHRAILLSPFTQVGVAVALDTRDTPYWCAVVATPL